MASYDFNRILMGTAADSFSFERFFRELGLAALARKAFGAGCNVMLSPLQSCAPPGGGSVANLSRHPFHTNPASQRRAKFVVSQMPIRGHNPTLQASRLTALPPSMRDSEISSQLPILDRRPTRSTEGHLDRPSPRNRHGALHSVLCPRANSSGRPCCRIASHCLS